MEVMQSLPLEEDLIDLNKEGLIAGPGEVKLAFFTRAHAMLDEAPESPSVFPNRVRDIFDIYPSHIEVIYSDEGMDIWEAGCTWILGHKVTVQLREHLRLAARWFCVYSKEEILCHEAVHAARMKFYEPMFEEFLAYQTSKWKWRRILGPLFRSQGETYGFLFFVLLGLSIALWLPFLGSLCMLVAPTYFFTRLMMVHYYFQRAKKKIRKMTGVSPLWVLLRLTDVEIRMFATQPIRILEHYVRERVTDSVRWQQIYQSYFI